MALKEIQYYSMNECLSVQMGGLKVCKNCSLYGTERCGGQQILDKGKNAKGYVIGENGLTTDTSEISKKKKKRKK